MEKLNIIEIIKRNPAKFKKLYSPLLGNVIFCGYTSLDGTIYVYREEEENKCHYSVNYRYSFHSDGRFMGYLFKDSECMLFPSRDKRDWNYDYPKFDPKTLQPFDKILVRDSECEEWYVAFFSHIVYDLTNYDNSEEMDFLIAASCGAFSYCIPYNNETKHLVGTNEEAPEFYKYWE